MPKIMEIQKIEIDKINPAKYNPRLDLQPGDSDYEKLKKSMQEFDLVEPLIWNKRSGNLVGGHQRLKILIEQGKTDVEVSVVDLPDSKEKALNLALNKISGDWDLPKLKDLLQELDTGEFDMEIAGFDDIEIENLMTQFYEPDEKDDVIPEVQEEPITKLGDLYKLGNHRLLCGDATKIDDVERLMNGNKADMVFTDPPYGINLNTDYSPISKNWKGQVHYCDSKKYNQVIGDNFKFNFEDFEWIDCQEQFWWGANYYLNQLPEDGSWFIWDKTAGHAQQVVGNEFEVLWSKKKHRQEIIIAKWAGAMGLQTQDIKKRLHPTQKPLEVYLPIINKFSKENDIVIDLFGGSGSTLIACEKLKRKCYMMEIDEHYCDVIKIRWEDYTGKKAEMILNG